MKKILASLWLLVLLIPAFPAGQVKPDGRRAWEHVNHLASDAFKGRKSGTPEYELAARYVAEKMKEFGLQPGGKKGSYFQQVEFKTWTHFEPPTRLEIISPKARVYRPGRSRDFIPNSGSGSGIVRGALVFVGYGLINERYQWDDYDGLEVKDKIVMLLPGAPEFMEDIARKETSLEAKVERAKKEGAAGILFMNVGDGIRGRRWGAGPKKGVCPEGFVLLTANPHVLDDIFYMAGSSWRFLVSRTIREKRSYNLELDVTVEMEAHFIQEKRTAPNVIGVLPGKHPQLKEEYIILGGHLDHLGVGLDGTIYNGADDNAASAGVILELARVLRLNDFQPDRTLVFAAWAGEELGLVGSRFYTKNPLFPLDKTAVYMNIDMVGTGDDDLFVGGMWEFSDFYDLLKQNMPEKYHEKLNYRLNYRGSDHSAFLPVGVTAISLRTGNPLTQRLDDEHPEYHKPGDAPATIQPELLELAAEYHYDIISYLANCRENLLDPVHHIHFVHKDATVVDMHCDTIGRFLRGADLSQDLPRGHIDIPKLQQGALDLQIFACYVGPPSSDAQKHRAAKRVFDQVDAVHQLVDANPDDMVLVTTYNDIYKLRGNRKVGAIIGIEGGYAIENDLRLLRSFYRSGVRLMTLTHWLDSDWADASGDPDPQLSGLTEFGEEVVQEMNRLGMIIDVSHVHDETFWDVIRVSDSPVVASHSCCRALSDHHRNMSDRMLKALAKNGGVIGINYLPGFLNAENDKKLEGLRAKLLEKYGLPEDRKEYVRADVAVRQKFAREFQAASRKLRDSLPEVNVATVVDHIEHVIEVTGSKNHVGLGSDFDGISTTPVGLEHTGKLANITAELVRRGYKDADIKKILGGNFLRVFRKVCGPRQDNP